jgi:pimeloyl-ACP methyl ester carboxylesterase
MQQRELAFDGEAGTLRGTLSLPDGDGPWPGLVTLHGSSEGRRDFRLFGHLESLLVPAGFALLRYDRRGSGESDGDIAMAGFPQLAGDAIGALTALAMQPEVDQERVGFFGHSQGGWIGPEAAARSPMVAFMVLVGACAVTPAEQMRYAAATALRAAGFDESVVDRALAARAAVDDAVRGLTERAPAARLVESVRAEPWFEWSFLPAIGARPAAAADDEKWRLEMDYDIAPALERTSVPVLLIHGDHDRWSPIEASQRAWQHAYRDRVALLTMVRIPGTGHYPTLAKGLAGEEMAPISPDYEALLLRWLRGVAG